MKKRKVTKEGSRKDRGSGSGKDKKLEDEYVFGASGYGGVDFFYLEKEW